jgi:hypothetical protein
MSNLLSLGECLFTLVGFCIVAYGIWRAWVPDLGRAIYRLFVSPNMSSNAAPTPAQLPPVSIPILDTSIPEKAAQVVLEHYSAVSRHMPDSDIIVLLASQKDGSKWRYSANGIYELVKGNRNDVLKTIASIRDTTEYVGDLIKRVNGEVNNGKTS